MSLKEIKIKAFEKGISLNKICKDLNISNYRLQKLNYLKDEVLIKRILNYLDTINNNINLNNQYKDFSKILIEKNLSLKKFCELNNIPYKSLYMYLKGKRKKKNLIYDLILSEFQRSEKNG